MPQLTVYGNSIGWYRLTYMKHMITTNQKSTSDIQELMRKEFKHNTTESHQHVREESKRLRKEQGTPAPPQKNQKIIKWQ